MPTPVALQCLPCVVQPFAVIKRPRVSSCCPFPAVYTPAPPAPVVVVTTQAEAKPKLTEAVEIPSLFRPLFTPPKTTVGT